MIILAVALALAYPAGQETVDSPEYQGWSAFQPGDWVMFRGKGQAGRPGDEVLYKLLALDKDRARIEFSRTVQILPNPPETTTQPVEIPARIPRDRNWQAAATKKGAGVEEIECGGQTVKCAWVEWALGETTLRKLWSAPEIPGGLAKIVEKGPGVDQELVVVKWSSAVAAGPAPGPPAGAKDATELARKNLAAGADLKLDAVRLPEACESLSQALGVHVFSDPTGIVHRQGKRVTITLSTGVAAGDALTAALKPLGLVWTFYWDAVVITDAREKQTFERNGAIGAPSDDVLKKQAALWENRDRPVELRAGMTLNEAAAIVAAGLGTPPARLDPAIRPEKKVTWTSTRPALVQLRILYREWGVELDFQPNGVNTRGEPGAVAKAMEAARCRTTCQNARTAGYTGREAVYKALLPTLRKDKGLAKEIIADMMESPAEDDKGRKVLTQLIKDIQ